LLVLVALGGLLILALAAGLFSARQRSRDRRRRRRSRRAADLTRRAGATATSRAGGPVHRLPGS
jgi:hypothetical protein